MNNRQSIFLGLQSGAIAWAIYAIVECYFVASIPWISNVPSGITHPHPVFSALLLLIYPIMGAIFCGGIAFIANLVAPKTSFLKSDQIPYFVACFTPFSLVVAYTVNLIGHWFFYPPLYFPLFLIIIIYIVVFFWSILSPEYPRFNVILNPVSVSLILLGVPILPESIFGITTGVKIVLTIIYFGLVCTAAKAIGFIKLSEISPETSPAKSIPTKISVLSMLAIIGIGLNIFLQQQPNFDKLDFADSIPDASKPNILLITWDTVRADHLSLYDYDRETTPHLENFAQNANVYLRAVASGDMTLATHASIFTGLPVRWHGAHFAPPDFPGGRQLSSQFDTLAEILSRHNYATAAIASNHAYITHDFGLDQGFQYFDVQSPTPLLGKLENYFLRRGVRDLLGLFAPRPIYDKLYRNADQINSQAIQVIERLQISNRPFFVFLNYMDAHDPYIPPPPYDTMYAGKDESFNSRKLIGLAEDIMKGNRSITEKELNHLNSQYDGAITYLDIRLNELINSLKKMDLYDDLLIIITSDHGEVFGDRGLFGHGVSVYQDQIHVPLIIKFPHQLNAKISNQLVSSIDILPTILDVADVEIMDHTPGQSLANEIISRTQPVVSEHFTPGYAYAWGDRYKGTDKAIFDDELKLILFDQGRHELYSLSKDQNELVDLSQSLHDPIKLLTTTLNDWIATIPISNSKPVDKLSPENLNRLKALGYVK